MEADFRGTETDEPLKHSSEQKPKSVGARQLLVITDGEVGENEEVLS
jgi:hypothetical protein